MARTATDARQLASNHGIDLSRDFHALGSDQVERINAAADAWAYRRPRHANGSRARYFHAFLQRLAARQED